MVTPRYRRARGLTLLECLITLAILAVLMAVGVPAFHDQLADARARAAAHQLYSALQFARTRALREGVPVTVCPVSATAGGAVKCDGDFGQSIMAWRESADADPVLRIWTPPEGVAIRNRAGTERVTGGIEWDANGLGHRNLTLSVCAVGRNWSVVVNRLGRPRIAKDWGHCPS